MTDMPNEFWSGWVVLITVISFIGLAWLVLSVYFMPTGRDHGQSEPVWDGNLEEGSSPAPMWWFWMILAMMVFSVMYLMLYPGLGSFAGAFRWSQESQVDNHTSLFELEFAGIRESLSSATLAELSENPVAMDSARRLFMDNCAACHGADGRGQANAFPDLRDTDWLWGSTSEQIDQTIRNGRTAAMISWQALLGDQGVANVADYVQTLANGGEAGHPGQMQYNQFCVACHGPAGDGNVLLGAPRLNDDVWLYGGDIETIRATIAGGRNGQMPAFGERLDDLQIRMLIAWLTR